MNDRDSKYQSNIAYSYLLDYFLCISYRNKMNGMKLGNTKDLK